MKKTLLLLITFTYITLLFSQLTPSNYFRSPVDVPIYLSGTFGEPRNTHFHTGIDIKTQGVEGKNIYAVADGYVSRIGVSPYGYGNALYITHPNGYVSVYGHLLQFSNEINQWVKNKQTENASFEINEENLPPTLFPVVKGQVVALSGNTGGSGGPHLHFEIRDSLEHPLNPLLFGFDKLITDNAKPAIYNLFLYNLDEERFFTESKKQAVTNISSGNYTIANTIVSNKNEIGVGVHTLDLFTGTSNKNGVYEIKLYDNGGLCYDMKMDTLNFDYGKHVYSQCDFWAKRSSGQTVYKCFTEKGNRIPIHVFAANNGKLFLYDNEIHQIKIEVSDFYGNTSTLTFKIKYDTNASYFSVKKYDYNSFFIAGERNNYRTGQVDLSFPKETFFDDLYFTLHEKVVNGQWMYEIQNTRTPVSGYFDIALQAATIDTIKSGKYLIAFYDYNGRKKSVGGTYRNGFIHAQTRDFGTYFIDLDIKEPTISLVNIYEGKNMAGQKKIQIKASDDFSGIEEYSAFVNNQWVVLTYDAKRNLFEYIIDDAVVKGNNTLELIISDERKNSAYKLINFIY